MKVIFYILLIKCLLTAETVVLPESTVAVVNGIAISEDELDREVGKELPKAYYHATLDDEKLKVIKEKSLTLLIEKNLLYQYAISKNITVTDDELEEIIKQLEKVYESKNTLVKALHQIGHTFESFKKAVKKDEILKKLYKKEIEADYSDDELRDYYEKNKYKFKEPEKIRVRLIHVKNDPKDPNGKEKAKQRILQAKEKIEAGEKFADIAAKYSTAMSRIKGGDMGYLHRGRLDASVEEKAFSMDINETSEIIEKDIGYFIVKVEGKKEQKQLLFETVKDGLKKDLKKKEEDKRKAVLLEKLMATAVIIK